MPSEYDALLEQPPTQQRSEYDQLLEQPSQPKSGVGQALENAGAAALNVAKGFVKGFLPKFDTKSLVEIAFAPAAVASQTMQAAEGAIDAVKQVGEAEKTPAWSRERFEAGFNVAGQLAMIAGIKGGVEAAYRAPVTDVASVVNKEVIDNAIKSNQEAGTIPVEQGKPVVSETKVQPQARDTRETPTQETTQPIAKPVPQPEQPRILSTAVQREGQIFQGQNPTDMHVDIGEQHGLGVPSESERGFIVQEPSGETRLVGREEGGKVADQTGQRPAQFAGQPLTSEHLQGREPEVKPTIPEKLPQDITWEQIHQKAEYVRKLNTNHLVTVSPSTTKEGWSRINYWDQGGIVSHLEVPDERLDSVLQKEAYPRGAKIISVEGGIGGTYPSADYAGMGFRPDVTAAKGVKTFVGPTDSVDWMKGRLESGGYKVSVKDVPEPPKPSPVSQVAESTTAEPLTKKGGVSEEKVQVQGQGGQGGQEVLKSVSPEQLRRDWIDEQRKSNPKFAPDIESWKELLTPNELKEVSEWEDLKYKSVAMQGPEKGYKPYKLTSQQKKRLVELTNKYGPRQQSEISQGSPSNDIYRGVNQAGEHLYATPEGQNYRIRNDRKSGPYLDYGGDLAPVSEGGAGIPSDIKPKSESGVPPTPPETPPPSTSSTEPTVSAIANRFVTERAAKGEVAPISPGQGYSAQEMVHQGLKMGPEEINQHVSDLMQGKGDPVKQAQAVRANEARLSQISNQLSREYELDPTNMEKKLAADNAFKDLTDWHTGPVAKIKTIFHATGEGLQSEIPVDLSTFNGMREAWLKDTGKPPPPEVESTLRKAADRVAKSNGEADASVAKIGAEVQKATSNRKLPTYEQVRNNILERLKAKTPCN